MGYRYIGAKTKISNEIISEISKIVPSGGKIADIMCGTGVISLELRKKGGERARAIAETTLQKVKQAVGLS